MRTRCSGLRPNNHDCKDRRLLKPDARDKIHADIKNLSGTTKDVERVLNMRNAFNTNGNAGHFWFKLNSRQQSGLHDVHTVMLHDAPAFPLPRSYTQL
jgi:hypothetical protein